MKCSRTSLNSELETVPGSIGPYVKRTQRESSSALYVAVCKCMSERVCASCFCQNLYTVLWESEKTGSENEEKRSHRRFIE